jgi:hypothetical protein
LELHRLSRVTIQQELRLGVAPLLLLLLLLLLVAWLRMVVRSANQLFDGCY